ncbi:HD domain-containing protein [Kitasatospora aureofaciens]|uniref:HD domain-containing protein n=1 Tax=Kitasatospora aureofaciens TaxID=1894 RepID=UPI001C4422D4|nr:HD domain-containing protein [Kitasatospora aureofaciens]MBV6698971.1 HD domain-containing protein [Kitasatospora aureofaciens]
MDYLSLAEVETIARRAHEGQVDKNGHPYSEHIAAVARGTAARGGSEAQIAAGWLHDTVEDDRLSREWLAEAALPEETKAIVDALTRRPDEPVEEYTARILATPGALLVKRADLAHNSDPARLAVLDEATAARLSAKYTRMRELLGLTGEL